MKKRLERLKLTREKQINKLKELYEKNKKATEARIKKLQQIKPDRFEIRRKLFHIFFVTAFVVLLANNIINTWIVFGLLILSLFISFLAKHYNIPVINWFLKNFEREKHMDKFPGKGAVFVMLGIWLSLMLFDVFYGDKNMALAAIIIMGWGDSIAALVGKHFGRIKNPLSNVKLLEGSVAGVVAGFLGALFFVSPLEAFLASLIAMAVEALELKVNENVIDDNISVTITAGAVIFFMRIISAY